jgi:hypothetical protein
MEYLKKIEAVIAGNLKKALALVAAVSVMIGGVVEYLTKIVEAIAN